MTPRFPHNPLTIGSMTLLLSLGSLVATSAASQPEAGVGSPPALLDPGETREILEEIEQEILRGYVDPGIAETLAQRIREISLRTQGSIPPAEFARRVSQTLQDTSRDRHLRLVYRPGNDSGRVRVSRPGSESDRTLPRKKIVIEGGPGPGRAPVLAKGPNHHFRKVEVLDGNLGYLDVREFVPDPAARKTAAAALEFLAETDGLIIDLRRHTGGSNGLVTFLSSYFFGPDPVHLNTFHDRLHDRVWERWTEAVPETRFRKKPLVLLTSRFTFSAAEDFAYTLKHHGRARIVGEKTGGGAHPSIDRPLDHDLVLLLPCARVVHPVTGTDWEGTGVLPDVPVSADRALEEAVKLLRTSRGSE